MLDDDTLKPLVTDLPLPAGQDYAALRAEGLRHLQRLSGLVWTDYNDHDPGVTLLEALCFALTDVSYRAALPMADLLAVPPLARADNRLLVPPHQAFANHPVTLDDYKKLVLDRFHGQVENAWVTLLPRDPGQPAAAAGHYRVALELYPEPPGEASPLGAPERARLLAQVQHTLNRNRNLGEVFGPAVLLNLHPVVVGGRFDLGPDQNSVTVLAELLHELSEVIDPSLETMRARDALRQHMAVEDIFSGPRVQNQLYVQSTFRPQTRQVVLGTLLRQTGLAGGLTGQYQVIDLQLYDGAPGADQTTAVEQLVFADNEVGSLDATESLRRLTLTRQGVPIVVDQQLVLRAYRKLVRTANQRRQGEGGPGQLRLPRRPGRYANLGRYSSVQRLLPTLYGVGEDGPLPDTSALGRAHIMQLKGYMLLFDQLLADFCAQLAHVGDFFSIASQPETYYSGLLYDVPHVAPLLPGTNISPDESWGWKDRRGTEAKWDAYKAQPRNAYRRSLAALAASNGPNLARRRDFLAHMLARFGYTVRLRHETLDAALGEEEAAVVGYEQLLAQLDQATYHRGAAWVPLPTAPGQPARGESGLELFLFLLAGVESLARKWARGEQLYLLERQVQLGTQPHPNTPPRLVVRGPAQHFTRVLDVLEGQRRRPDLLALGPDTLRLNVDSDHPHDIWEVTLAGAPPPPGGAPGIDSVAQRLLAFAADFDRQLERVCLLDHVVLEPLAAREPNSGLVPDEFYHCQATMLLPGYAYRYRTQPGPDGVRQPSANRATLERLIRQYAPAHVLVNMVWLDYPQMREWEHLYGVLAHTSDLLRADGLPERVTLAAAQLRARAFLEDLLAAGAAPVR
ncbi:hypothetical protein [Hymenobacter ruricola]|uniref:hypothetical protein n=1 Tax=Hymenobacter ruricola TaxID=2791023 RepID=UPI0018AF8A88|nr:hypothetical protein [Hymenobacter ruricola]